MPVLLAILVAIFMGASSALESLSIRMGDAWPMLSQSRAAAECKPECDHWLVEPLHPVAPDRLSTIANDLATRENAEAMREAEEEESEDNHWGRSLSSALIFPPLWNGPSEHARPAPDPSRLPHSRPLFLLCGQLLC